MGATLWVEQFGQFQRTNFCVTPSTSSGRNHRLFRKRRAMSDGREYPRIAGVRVPPGAPLCQAPRIPVTIFAIERSRDIA
jgi:hypothetical protein